MPVRVTYRFIMKNRTYVLTDASKLYWSGVLASGLVVDTERISNVLKHQGDRLSQELQMRPMYFISGAFKGSQYH